MSTTLPTTPRPAGGYDSCPAELTQAQCHTCRVLFRWQAPPLQRDAACPSCGQKLHRCIARHCSFPLSTVAPVAAEVP